MKKQLMALVMILLASVTLAQTAVSQADEGIRGKGRTDQAGEGNLLYAVRPTRTRR